MATSRGLKQKYGTKPIDEHATRKELYLFELLNEVHLTKLHDIFRKEEDKKLSQTQLKDALYKLAKITCPADEFDLLFKRINIDRNDMVSWNEFVSYLMLIYEQKKIPVEYAPLDLPIPKKPIVIRSHHRYPINRITYCPTMHSDRTISWQDGSVLSCSRDGTINYWSLDMALERTVQSTCPELRVQTTWVTDLITMPDLSVVCTSGTERDLRFYDTSARKFELRIMFTSIEYAVMTMNYVFSKNVDEESKLLLGDKAGNIYVIFIESRDRGAFRSRPGLILLHVRFEKVLKGLVDGFRVVSLRNRHDDYVRQIDYYPSINTVVTCSNCWTSGLVMSELNENKPPYIYNLPRGAWCFALVDGKHLIASGGGDSIIRLWNPFLTQLPTATFYGHHTGVISMIFQDDGAYLYSLSQDKNIRVWDVVGQNCLQTYLGLPASLGEHVDLVTLYNPEARQWIVGGVMLGVIPLKPRQSGDHTDGNTHLSGVSIILYNPLYRVVITCGLDSYIIVWNPWDGRRLMTIKQAHTKSIHAELTSIEITAATFDPGHQRLITGAHDGTLKIWNFNTGTCLRNMRIEEDCEIRCIVWIKMRIMAMGWNKRITEFADNTEIVSSDGEFKKDWDLRHLEEISAASYRLGQTLATTTYNGELILWRLETGQPYKQYNVSDPTTRIKIKYKLLRDKDKKDEVAQLKQQRQSIIVTKRKSVAQQAAAPFKGRKVSTIVVPDECIPLRKLAVHAIMFLEARPMDPQYGTLVIALENGVVQMWSHHIAGSFMTSFSAIHKAGDYIVSMASDSVNEFLFVGTTLGYIKTWLLKNFCVPEEVKEHICMPRYRLMFPFLWHDRFVGRAARIARFQKEPLLLNSYRGHLMPISGLIFINAGQILMSASADSSVRLWTLSGQYLQTLGTFKKWKYLENNPVSRADFGHKLPPDLTRVASSTTFRVLLGGATLRYKHVKASKDTDEASVMDVDASKVYGQRVNEPVLGNYYKAIDREVGRHEIDLDTTYPYIPVYQHLIMPTPTEINYTIPEIIKLKDIPTKKKNKK